MCKTNNTKTLYILSETIERDISTPVIYLDFNSALSELISRMAQAFGYPESDINDMFADLNNGELDDCFLCYDEENGVATAYGENANHDNCDWDISPVEIPG